MHSRQKSKGTLTTAHWLFCPGDELIRGCHGGLPGRINEGSWEEIRFSLSPGKGKGADALGRENNMCKALAGR